MSTITIIVVALAALLLIGLAASLLRKRALEREVEHDRLSGEASAHREQADSNIARARELGREAESERSEAERHAIAAEEHTEAAAAHAERARALEQRIRTAGSAAAFHDERAAEREQKLA